MKLQISSNKQARVSTSAAEFDHQPKSVAVGPTANAAATGSNTQSPTHVGATNGASHETANITGPEVTDVSQAI